MPSFAKAAILQRVCEALGRSDPALASEIARTEYPFVACTNAGRTYTPETMTRVFVHDGFLDRYTGEKLVFPGALRLLTVLLPAEFPAHPSWKMTETHMALWEMFPTIDHVIPVARGGADNKDNWSRPRCSGTKPRVTGRSASWAGRHRSHAEISPRGTA